MPGLEKSISEVTLENEPSDPPVTNIITADGIEVGIDYIISDQIVVDPVKVATEIAYGNRASFIVTRLKGYFQDAFADIKAEDLLFDHNGKTVMNKKKQKAIEREVNDSLKEIEESWGIIVKIELENLILPEKLMEVAEESGTAEREGERIRKKAEKAGVAPELMTITDALTDIVRAFRNGGKK